MKERILKARGVLIAVLAVIASVVQVLTAGPTMRVWALVSLLVISLAILVFGFGRETFIKWRADKGLPPVDKLQDLFAGYSLEPAKTSDIHWIAELEARVYPPSDAVPEPILREWYQANPSGFSIIKSSDDKAVGHIDILPLKPQTLARFIQGEIVEKEIRGDSLYSISERASIKTLYVESVIILPPPGRSNAPALVSVLSSVLSLVQRIGDVATIEHIYAVAASEPGENLLKELGFYPLTNSQTRRDRHNLYEVEFATLASTVAKICGDRLKQAELLQQLGGSAGAAGL